MPPPQVVFSTHFDCVPPFFPSREERGMVFGRGVVRREGHSGRAGGGGRAAARDAAKRGSRCCSSSAKSAAATARASRTTSAPDGVRFLINGEPTDNRLGVATRGVLRVRLRASGRAAHSSFPELGDSAIDKLLDALMVLRGVALPDDPRARTHALHRRAHRRRRGAERRLAARVRRAARSESLATARRPRGAARRRVAGRVEHVLDIPAVRMHTRARASTPRSFRTRPTFRC